MPGCYFYVPDNILVLKKICFVGLIVLFCTPTSVAASNDTINRPKLVVGIVVDQMRADYLYRFYERFSDSGFKRLMKKGANCRNAYINYIPTYTAPGHTSIYTGSVPALHGIAGNDWIDGRTGEKVYCTQDDTARTIGSNSGAGNMSPRNLLVTTLTDELRMATNFRSRVFGVAIKDRGAILPAGHTANGAFWYDDATGNFITSSYYMKELPFWLDSFNRERLADTFLKQGWSLSHPLATYRQSTFYHYGSISDMRKEEPLVIQGKTGNYNSLRTMPAGNTISFELAKACIAAERLGRSGATDFITLSLSSTDYIGHKYGPNSAEVEDTYLKLDRDIGAFLSYLDKTIGKGKYLLFLTADHGAANSVAYDRQSQLPGSLFREQDLYRQLDSALLAKYGTDSLVAGVLNYQVYFNEQKIKNKAIDRDGVKDYVSSFCSQLPGVLYAIDAGSVKEILPGQLNAMVKNGYHCGRSGTIFIILKSGYYSSNSTDGTTHGSLYAYDTHIPLVWYGWHIKPAEVTTRVKIVDIASTLADLLHIQVPSGNIGKTISEIYK